MLKKHSNDDTAAFSTIGACLKRHSISVALPIFATVEYASGDRVLPWKEVSFFLALAGGFCYGWRARKEMRE